MLTIYKGRKKKEYTKIQKFIKKELSEVDGLFVSIARLSRTFFSDFGGRKSGVKKGDNRPFKWNSSKGPSIFFLMAWIGFSLLWSSC